MKWLQTVFQVSAASLMLLCIYAQVGKGQVAKANTTTFDGCEEVSLKLDLLADKYRKTANNNSFLVVIGEYSRHVYSSKAERRISDAIKYLTLLQKIPMESIVRGSTKVSGEIVKLRFYLNGELTREIISRDRSILCFGAGETFNAKGQR